MHLTTPGFENQRTRPCQFLQSEIDEVNKHKWIASEKAQRDVGWEWALMNWIIYHRANWARNQLSLKSDSLTLQSRR